jgi:hypothetical protein
MAVIRSRHAARLLFRRLSKPSAEYVRERCEPRAVPEMHILAIRGPSGEWMRAASGAGIVR